MAKPAAKRVKVEKGAVSEPAPTEAPAAAPVKEEKKPARPKTAAEVAHERATKALWELVKLNPTAHEAIAKAGNPSALVELLKTCIPDAKDYAVWSLSLSISADTQGVVAESGGVQPLIDQLGDARTLIQQQAAAALAKLARDNDETRSMITKLGGVRPLIGLLSLSEAAIEAALASKAARIQARIEAELRKQALERKEKRIQMEIHKQNVLQAQEEEMVKKLYDFKQKEQAIEAMVR